MFGRLGCVCVCVLNCLVCLGCFEKTVAMLWHALLDACFGICSCCHVLQQNLVLAGLVWAYCCSAWARIKVLFAWLGILGCFGRYLYPNIYLACLGNVLACFVPLWHPWERLAFLWSVLVCLWYNRGKHSTCSGMSCHVSACVCIFRSTLVSLGMV